MARVKPARERAKVREPPDDTRTPTGDSRGLADRGDAHIITNDHDPFSDEDRCMTTQHSLSTSERPTDGTAEPRTVQLPIEVHERIIGFLDNYNASGSIAVCALVCRSWLPFSRFKLYYSINLFYRRQWVAFHLMLHSNSMQGYLSMVQELHLRPSNKCFLDADKMQLRIGWDNDQERPWVHLALLECATRLKGLIKLHFAQADLSPSHPIAIGSGQHLRTVTFLKLEHTEFSCLLQFHQFITAFPALTHLHLCQIKLESRGHWLPVPTVGRSLRSLTVEEDINTDVIVKYFTANPQLVQSLHKLCWNGFEISGAALRNMMAAISPAFL